MDNTGREDTELAKGDIVKELQELPEPPLDELLDRITRLDNDYKAGRIDAIGRPIAGAASDVAANLK